ncbi:pyrroline-5-carboxylate reductase [Methanobrevibacter sp. 87.7]|uniref:pyrroline-5-carboxylate reductase family protein n=1 Tax=Methanobrevibacter sp. 87.7 TaxID=387957 RepID=UPI000B50DD0F|nr:NAD(P)-binding domain-containing protein [Methanobrevibacter sp. 87.7]
MTIGIIGYGNIGQMITENLLKLNLVNEDELIISNRNISKLESLKEYYPNINITDDNNKLAKESDKIIISVESDDLLNVISEIKQNLNNTHIIHTCAGINFEDIENIYDGPVSLVIPTIASEFVESDNPQNGISLIVHNDNVNFIDSSKLETLFNEFSYVKILPDEEDIEIATILTSCAPAYIGLIVKKLSEFGFKHSNLDYEECKYLILKTLIGSSEVLLKDKINSDDNCDKLINKVCTPNGITEKD